MRRTCWFPDNTVLCNFAVVDSVQLLESVLDGRGRWTTAVAFEAQRSAAYIPRLRDVTAGGWLGEPVEITDSREQELVDRVRRSVFNGPQESPLLA